jgi:hypothetical protein
MPDDVKQQKPDSLQALVGRLTEILVREEEGLRQNERYNADRGRAHLELQFGTAAEVVGALARALHALSKPPNK